MASKKQDEATKFIMDLFHDTMDKFNNSYGKSHSAKDMVSKAIDFALGRAADAQYHKDYDKEPEAKSAAEKLEKYWNEVYEKLEAYRKEHFKDEND